MGNKDYIPNTDEKFRDWSRNLYDYALAHYTGWSVPSPHISLEALLTAYESAFAAAQNPNRGKLDVLRKNETRNALKKAVRLYVKAYLINNPAVTDEDKVEMGLPLHDGISTPHPVPKIKPETEVIPIGKGKHQVTALNPQSRSKQKPALVKGVAFARHLRRPDESPLQAKEMPSEFQSATTREYQWSEADYGKVADYATAYENEGGKRGPWSDVKSVLID
ncbi:MAG: hypothetical protein LBP19_02835 [Treponema sp.]|jgi:hypothetical protein|nr:hypothetical protein [Treponema sp.]